jgi:hypothetical protein
LRLGLSVDTSVDINDTHGPLLTSIVQRHFFKEGQVVPNENLPPAARPQTSDDASQPQHHHLMRELLHKLHPHHQHE